MESCAGENTSDPPHDYDPRIFQELFAGIIAAGYRIVFYTETGAVSGRLVSTRHSIGFCFRSSVENRRMRAAIGVRSRMQYRCRVLPLR
jgi:nitrogen fixation protein FixH